MCLKKDIVRYTCTCPNALGGILDGSNNLIRQDKLTFICFLPNSSNIIGIVGGKILFGHFLSCPLTSQEIFFIHVFF